MVSLLSFNSGLTAAFFKSSGNVPDCSEVLIISVRIGMNSSR